MLMVLPRTEPANGSLGSQLLEIVAAEGILQNPPSSVVNMTTRFLLLHTHPLLPRKKRSEIWACIECWRKSQVVPPSVLRRMNPPPPPRKTVDGDSSHTVLTSACVSPSRRFTGLQLVPPSRLLTAAPRSPTAQSVEPLMSIAFRSLTAPVATGVHDAPPFVVLSTVPALPTAHPVLSLVKRTALSCAAVPEVWGVQEPPPSVVLRIWPAAPTT